MFEMLDSREYLAAGLYSLDEAAKDDQPGGEKTECETPARSPKLCWLYGLLACSVLSQHGEGQVLVTTRLAQLQRLVEQSGRSEKE